MQKVLDKENPLWYYVLKKGGNMKTKTVTMYVCEFCGLSSENKKNIEECEKGHKDVQDFISKQPKWGADFVKEVGMSAYKTALELLDESNNQVEIFETDELGEPEWAIVPIENTEFWLNNFPTKKEAENFCKEMGWKYV